MERSEDRRPGVRRAVGAAAAVACVAAVGLPLAVPLLYRGVDESRRELDTLLRRSQTVRQAEAARVPRVRALLDERLRETSWAREEALESLEEAARALSARPAPPPRREEPAAAPSPADDVVAAWVEDLARAIELDEGQRDGIRVACAEYRVRAAAALLEERIRPSGRGPERLRALQDEAVRRIESLLLPAQRIAYERLERKNELLRKAGVVVPPLPGTRVAGMGRR